MDLVSSGLVVCEHRPLVEAYQLHCPNLGTSCTVLTSVFVIISIIIINIIIIIIIIIINIIKSPNQAIQLPIIIIDACLSITATVMSAD
jgi:hypothetical protein